MNHCPLFIAQRAQNFSQNHMGPQRSLCPIVGWFYTWVNDKCEQVIESVANFADEFLDFFESVLFQDCVVLKLFRVRPSFILFELFI